MIHNEWITSNRSEGIIQDMRTKVAEVEHRYIVTRIPVYYDLEDANTTDLEYQCVFSKKEDAKYAKQHSIRSKGKI